MDDEIVVRGRLKLQKEIAADTGENVEHLDYDFERISGTMLLNVLGDGDANGKGGITNRQALELFLKACAPEENAHMTANEIRQKISAQDMPICMKLGAAFFMRTYVSGLTNLGER